MRASAAATIVAVALAVPAGAVASGADGRRAGAAGAVLTLSPGRGGDRLRAAPAERAPSDSLPLWLVPAAGGALLVAMLLVRRRR
jgi:hypothetical protein